MAKKRKGNVAVLMGASPSHNERMSTDITKAENGFIVNVSGDKGGKNPGYFHKSFIASTRPAAMHIAATHFSGSMKSRATKKGGNKKATKR